MGLTWSNENDTPTRPNANQRSYWPLRKKPPVDCSACFEKLDYYHGGIKCGKGHNLCNDPCSKTFMDTVLEEPQLRIPAKCPICSTVLKNNIVEQVLEPKQLEKYQYHLLRIAATSTKVDGEVFCTCPFCDYFEYQVGKEEDILFVTCKDPKCGKKSCVVCKLTVNENEKHDVARNHSKCQNLRKHKSEFERVLAAGNSMPCPQCGLAGMKDIQCSHITCPKCSAEWCYVCGQIKQCLGLPGSESLYDHFKDWKLFETRCPPYLQCISELNSDFPNDAQGALQKFHENRSKMLLKKFVDDIGVDDFNELRTHFQSVEHCGFTAEEIQNAPEHVFRPPPTLFVSALRRVRKIFQFVVDAVCTLTINTFGEARLRRCLGHIPIPVRAVALYITVLFLVIVALRLIIPIAGLVTFILTPVLLCGLLVWVVRSLVLFLRDNPKDIAGILFILVVLYSLPYSFWVFMFSFSSWLVHSVVTILMVFCCVIFALYLDQ